MVGTLSDVGVLSREAFDAIEFDAAYSGDHRAAAQRMTLLADTGTQTPTMPRAEAYTRAGEQWLLADEPAAAANGFMRALEDGGPSYVDPRAPLARALFMMGRTADAETLIRELAAEPPREPRMCDLLAELLVERSDPIGALAWANAGVELWLGRSPGPVASAGDADTGAPDEGATGDGAGGIGADPVPGLRPGDRAELRLLLSLRYRIRNDLGLPEDAYDQLLDELPSEPGTVAGGLPDTTTSASAAASRSTKTVSPSVIPPDNRPLAN
jgi:tetratricopeptide repeat protein